MKDTYLTEWKPSAVGSLIHKSHFGANMIAFNNDLSTGGLFGRALNELSPTSLRYPGGTTTEDNFDPNSIFFDSIFEEKSQKTLEYETGGEVATVRATMQYAKENNMSVDFVLPTEHLLKEGALGTRALDKNAIDNLMDKINGLVRGEYGDAKIGVFEIGNEYFVKERMTAEEYGLVANRVTLELKAIYNNMYAKDPSWIAPKIAVQAAPGYLSGDNDTIINSLSLEARHEIDVVIGHYYPRSLEQTEKFGLFFGNLHAWERAEGFNDLEINLSEWNIQNSIGADRGLHQASGLVGAFHELVEQGVDAASIWAVQFRDPGTAMAFTRDPISGIEVGRSTITDLTASGYLFQQMGRELPGLRSLNIDPKKIAATDESSNIDVKVFGNSNRSVVYISSRSDSVESVTLHLDEYFEGSQHLSASHISAVDDPRTEGFDESIPNSSKARISVRGVTADDLLADGGKYTLQPGDILQVTVTYQNHGVSLKGFQPLDPVPGDNYSDNFVGTAFGDSFNGFDGDDTIQGKRGPDIISGGSGDDVLSGGSNSDVIFGESENDTLFGADGDDLLRGGGGNDKLFGGSGGDRIDGGEGRNILHGGLGNDTLLSLSGSNSLIGEGGGDLFVASVEAETRIIDFSYDSGDRLSLLGFYEEVIDLKSRTTVVEDLKTGTSDIVISHESGSKTILVDAGDQYEVLGEAIVDLSDPNDTAVALAETLNALSSDQVYALMTSFNSDDFEQQIMMVDSNSLLLGLNGKQAGAFLKGMLPDEATEFYERVSDATFSEFVHGLGPNELLSFITELGAEQMDHFTNVIPDDALDYINETVEAVDDDVASINEEVGATGYETDDNPVDQLPRIPVQGEEVNDDDPSEESSSEPDVSPCFVATAAYRDRLHPDVVAFRLYRENILRKSAAGLAFIDFYWWIGPKLAVPVNRSKSLQIVSRVVLKGLLALLRRRHGDEFARKIRF